MSRGAPMKTCTLTCICIAEKNTPECMLVWEIFVKTYLDTGIDRFPQHDSSYGHENQYGQTPEIFVRCHLPSHSFDNERGPCQSTVDFVNIVMNVLQLVRLLFQFNRLKVECNNYECETPRHFNLLRLSILARSCFCIIQTSQELQCYRLFPDISCLSNRGKSPAEGLFGLCLLTKNLLHGSVAGA